MLESFIPSRTRINILVRLFLNPSTSAYLRQLAEEFGVSTNSVRTELNHLTKHGILVSERSGRNVLYQANQGHPLFPELASMVRKVTGVDRLVSSVVERLGELEAVYLVGDYAQGKDTGVIDVVLVGGICVVQLDDVVAKAERYLSRKVRTLVLSAGEFDELKSKSPLDPLLALWGRQGHGEPSRLAVDGHERQPMAMGTVP